MQKILLALSLSLAMTLIAQESLSDNITPVNCDLYCETSCSYMDDNIEDDCCPAPCEPCIDCECYVPAFYDLQCDWGFFFDVEFLYWYARETNLPFAAKAEFIDAGDNTMDIDGVLYTKRVEHLKTSWDPGFRVGIGWNTAGDGWDGYLNWTYFNNSAKTSTSVNFQGVEPFLIGDEVLVNPFPNRAVDSTPFFSQMKASWRTRFNQIDLELGRKYFLSKCFVMRPFAGIRGAWTRTRFGVSGKDGPKTEFSRIKNSSNTYKTDIWGAGLLAGFQPTWYFCSNFALYANFDAALLWGEFEESKKETYFIGDDTAIMVNTINNMGDRFHTMSSLIDLAIGLRWEETWCCDRFRTALDIGWEHHTWFSHGYRYKTYGQIPLELDIVRIASVFTQFDYDVSDLAYGGLVVRFRWDF